MVLPYRPGPTKPTTDIVPPSMGLWKVIHMPRVAIRNQPSLSGKIVGAKNCGETVKAMEQDGSWLRVEGEVSGWMLSEGTSVGLGTLLERMN